MPSLCGELIHVSIHPPRVGWDGAPGGQHSKKNISIHPPRVGWDIDHRNLYPPINISIHPPRMGWDNGDLRLTVDKLRFQSTHPVWGGTMHNAWCWPDRRLVGPSQDSFPAQVIVVLRKTGDTASSSGHNSLGDSSG